MSPRSASALLIAALVTLASCPRRSPPSPPAVVTQGDVAEGPGTPPPSAPSPDAIAADDAGPPSRSDPTARRLSALADDIVGRVSELRSLPQRGPVARGVMSRSQVVERLRARTRQEYPPGEVEREGELLARLAMIPETMNYEQALYDLLEEQVLGFYDPDERRLYIADWVPAEQQPVTMAHELTHALQDQHFNIGRFTHHEQGRGDAQTAAMSVVEGDATAAMLEFMLRPQGRHIRDIPDVVALVRSQLDSGDQPRLRAAPRAIRETLLFPYINGLGLCARRLREGGWAAIDELLQRPPDSTEQVMHPERLSPRDVPIDVPARVPPSLAADWVLAYHDVMGELGARLHFMLTLNEARSSGAAQGWGGDRAMLLVPRDATRSGSDGGVEIPREALRRDLLLWVVTLDAGTAAAPDGEAVEFAGALAEVMNRRYVERRVVRVPGATAARELADGRVALVARVGRTVLLGDRVPADRAAAVVREALAAR